MDDDERSSSGWAGRSAVVTGGGHGIGRAIALRLAAGGLKVLVADLDGAAAAEVARDAGGIAWAGDCAGPDGVAGLLGAATQALGRVDLFVANAGVGTALGLDAPDEAWQHTLEVNLMAHVRAARLLVPSWLSDGRGGRFVVTASAAGLLSMIGDAPYSASKHAAVAFAEWLSLTYRDAGVVVQALCPQGVRTDMLAGLGDLAPLLEPGAISAEEVAEAVWQALQGDAFLILPHPEVARYYANRAADTDRWLATMNRMQTEVGVHRAGMRSER